VRSRIYASGPEKSDDLVGVHDLPAATIKYEAHFDEAGNIVRFVDRPGPTVKFTFAQTPPEDRPNVITLRLDRAGWAKLIASAHAGLEAAGPDEIVEVVVLGYSRDGR